MLCGWVIGEGTKGITLGHANGWMPNSWLPFGERLVDQGYMIIIWAFRGLYPSDDDPSGSDLRVEERWDLDVLAQITVPAFFAVSSNDPGVGGGDQFMHEVQELYDACASAQKEIHILTSYEHGTDLLSDEDVYSKSQDSTKEQKQERRQLADDLMRFVNYAFGTNMDETENGATDIPSSTSHGIGETEVPALSTDTGNLFESENSGFIIIGIVIGVFLLT